LIFSQTGRKLKEDENKVMETIVPRGLGCALWRWFLMRYRTGGKTNQAKKVNLLGRSQANDSDVSGKIPPEGGVCQPPPEENRGSVRPLTDAELDLPPIGDPSVWPIEERRRQRLKEMIQNFTYESPEKTASVIKDWLREG